MGYSRENLLCIRDNVNTAELRPSNLALTSITENGLQRLNRVRNVATKRGVRAGKNVKRPIRTVITSQNKTLSDSRGICHSNLSQINLKPQVKQIPELLICLANARSAGNKTDELVQYIIEHDIDVFIITETWLKTDDDMKIAELKPSGYAFEHVPRENRRGGGIAIVYKSSIRLKKFEQIFTTNSLEYMEVMLSLGNSNMRLVAVYRPPSADPSLAIRVPFSTFIDEFEAVMERHVTAPGNLVILGDFNIHVDTPTDNDAKNFLSLTKSMNLHQHVKGATHVSGHTLDLVLTRSFDKKFIEDLKVDMLLSDHHTILFKVKIGKPLPIKKTLTFRKLKTIDNDSFRKDLAQDIKVLKLSDNMKEAVAQYNSTMQKVLDKHAPEQTKSVTIRHHSPWYSDEIKQEKTMRRQLEKKWLSSRSDRDKMTFQEQRNKVAMMVKRAKSEFYTSLVSESKNNPKALFKVLDGLLHRNQEMPLPPHDSAAGLASQFAEYFSGKIDKVRTELNDMQKEDGCELPEERKYHTILSEFTPTTKDEIRQILMKAPTKSCNLDPMPTRLLKSCMDEVIPLLTKIVNLSFLTSIMPDSLKSAALTPLLKKAILELIEKNYRPVSNLTFLSKLIERVAAKRLLSHQEINHLLEALQSAYRRGHSTETALAKVQDDIQLCMDKGQVMLQILLDLSAAFDTIDHNILIKRLSDRMGITGAALKWVISYLQDRKQYVQIDGKCSQSLPLKYGVPQGSVLGPILFSMYMSPLGDIVRKHGAKFHVYADDTQVYMSAKPNHQEDVDRAAKCLQECVSAIGDWMTKNMLKLNKDKTEFIVFGTPQQKAKVDLSSIHIYGCDIQAVEKVKNLGVILDSSMSMNNQTKAVKKSAFYQIRNLRTIRAYLSADIAKMAVNALVTSRLDYCNSLLFGITQRNIHDLQLAQNAAARLVTNTRKFDHITPVLKDLHWLPIEKRIVFKVLLMTYKAVNSLGPSYLCELVKIHEPIRSLRSNDQLLLHVPKTKLVTAGDRSFSSAAPRLWNPLPFEIKTAGSVELFKKRLKTYLFKQCF